MSSASPTRSIARSAALVMIGMACSIVVGLLSKILVTHTFGTGTAIDSFYSANRLPEVLFNLVAGGALASAFIPTYTGLLTRGDPSAADRLASAVGSWLMVLLGVGCAVCALLAEPLVAGLLAPGFTDPVQRQTTVELLRVLLLCPTLFALSGLVMGILNAHHRFFFAALAPMFYPLGMIFGVLFLVPSMGVFGLAWGAVLGAALHLASQLPALLGVPARFRLSLETRESSFREVIRLMLPRLFGQAAVQLNFVINNILASLQPVGSITAITLGFAVMMMPEAGIAQAGAVAALPTFSAQASQGALDRLRSSFLAVTRGVFFLALPASVGLVLLADPIVRVLFLRGTFDETSAAMVVWALRWYSVGLVSHAVLEVLSRGFYALKDTFTPVLFSVLGMAFNVAFSLALVRVFQAAGWMPHGGLALATTLASFLETGAMIAILRRRLGGFFDRGLVESGLRTIGAGAFMAACLAGWMAIADGASAWIACLGGIATGVVSFFLAALLLRSPEARRMMDTVRARLPFRRADS